MSEPTKKRSRIRRGHAVPEIVQRKEMNESITKYMEKATEMIEKISETPKFTPGAFTPVPPSITPEERIEYNDLWAQTQTFQWLLEGGRYDWEEALKASEAIVEITREKRERANELQRKMGGYGSSGPIMIPARGVA